MPNNVLPILGERLKKARKDRGLTQEQLAEQAGLEKLLKQFVRENGL